MYVYHEYYCAEKVALVYPGAEIVNSGKYYKPKNEKLSGKECSIIKIQTDSTLIKWQKNICDQVYSKWLNLD